MYKTIVVFRSRVLVFLTHHMALPILKLIRNPEVFPYSVGELKNFPQGTLGRDLANMLEENNFQLLTHYAKHDMKHILLNYPVTDEGEVRLQAFMLGNRHASFPVISTLLYGFLTMPEYWSSFIKAFKKGRKADSIHDWKWNHIVTEKTAVLREKIFETKK